MAKPIRKSDAYRPEPPKEAPTHPWAGRFAADDLDKLDELKAEEAKATAAAKSAKEARQDFERYVLDRLEFERVPSLQSGKGVTYYGLHAPFPKVEDKEAFIEWALENAPELLDTGARIREAELTSELRQRLDDKQPLPPALGYYTKSSLGYRSS